MVLLTECLRFLVFGLLSLIKVLAPTVMMATILSRPRYVCVYVCVHIYILSLFKLPILLKNRLSFMCVDFTCHISVRNCSAVCQFLLFACVFLS